MSAGLCDKVSSCGGDLPERAIHLLQSMFIPVPDAPAPKSDVIVGACVEELFRKAPDIEDSMPSGPGPNFAKLKQWAAGPQMQSDPRVPMHTVRDDL